MARCLEHTHNGFLAHLLPVGEAAHAVGHNGQKPHPGHGGAEGILLVLPSTHVVHHTQSAPLCIRKHCGG